MERTARLGKERVSRLLLSFSAPAITGMFVVGLYGVLGAAFVGRGVGAAAIAGLTISFPVTMIIVGFAMISGLGATSLVSLRLGEGKRDLAEKVLGNAVTSSLCISAAVISLGLVFLKPILFLFGADAESYPYAVVYSGIMIAGSGFQSLSFCLNNIIRGEGNPFFALTTTIVGFAVYLIAAPLFIFVLHAGIGGAAAAVVISQFVSAVWSFMYFRSKRSILRLRRKNLVLSGSLLAKIYFIGAAPFIMQAAGAVIIVYINHQLGKLGGNTAITAMGISFTIYNLLLMPIFGINQGMQPIIGYNYGAKKFDRAKRTLTVAMIFATAVCLIGYVCIMVFARLIMTCFVPGSFAVIDLGSRALRIFLIALPLIGFQIVGTAYFQAVGKPKQTLFLSLLRQLIILVPLLVVLPRYLGLDGIWIAGPVSDTAAALMTAVLLFYEFAHLNKRHQVEKETADALMRHPEGAVCPPDREVGGLG
jgi:putative MATE family efflux protein